MCCVTSAPGTALEPDQLQIWIGQGPGCLRCAFPISPWRTAGRMNSQRPLCLPLRHHPLDRASISIRVRQRSASRLGQQTSPHPSLCLPHRLRNNRLHHGRIRLQPQHLLLLLHRRRQSGHPNRLCSSSRLPPPSRMPWMWTMSSPAALSAQRQSSSSRVSERKGCRAPSLTLSRARMLAKEQTTAALLRELCVCCSCVGREDGGAQGSTGGHHRRTHRR